MSEKQTETSTGGQDMGPFKAGAPFKFADVQSLQLAIQAYFGAFGLKHGWVAGGMAVEVGAEGGWRRLIQLGRRSERGIDRGRLGSRGLRGSRFLRRGRRGRGFGLTRRRCRGLGRRLRKCESRKERHYRSARDYYCRVRTSCHLWSLSG